MKNHFRLTLVLVLLVIFVIAIFGTAAAVEPDAVINEFVADHIGAETHEFIEVKVTVARAEDKTWTLLEIEGDGAGAGKIDGVWPITSILSAGEYWRTEFSDDPIGNGTITLMLVEGFSGSQGNDLDTNNDGVLDSMPWDIILDDVGVHDGGSSDRNYSAVVLAGGFDGDSSRPGGASRIPDGVDTNAIADWMRNDYDGAGLPDFQGSPAFGEAFNTPGDAGALNEAVPEPEEACGDDYTSIYTIQGDGDSSAVVGEEHATEGVVVGQLQGSSKLDGFYLQDPDGDGNPDTSDGIFVYAPGSEAVSEMDTVRVRGTVAEFRDGTQISNVSLVINCEKDPVTVAPTMVTLPMTDLGDWEKVEGMLVKVTNELFVSDVYDLVYRGETTLSADGINLSPTNVVLPGPTAPAAYHQANLLKSILLDDGSTWTNPWYPSDPVPYTGPEGTLRVGDTANDLVAVLGQSYTYRLQPTTSHNISFTYNARPMTPADVGGTIKVGTFNLHNYWTTIGGRGASSEEQLDIQRSKLADAILNMGVDIIGLQELESFHIDTDSSNDDEAVADLVDVLNTTAGSEIWAYISTPDTYSNTNAIINGIIYQMARVEPVGPSSWLDDPAFDNARPPIAQTFNAEGEIFTVVTNHFKSKSCTDATGLDEDQDDGQACYNATRVAEAEALVGFVNDLQISSGDDDVVVLGDLNVYIMEDPALVLGAPSSGIMDQVGAFIPTDERRSYNYFAESGELDYIYTSDEMEYIPTAVSETNRITGVNIWHIGPDEPQGFDYYRDPQLSSPPRFRPSDHDPVIMGFCDVVAPVVTVTATPDWIWPPNHRYHDIVVTVSAEDNFAASPTIWHEAEGWYMSNEPDNDTGDGNTTDDIILVSEEDGMFKVRAERAGHGSGRTYTFTYKATDSCGNVGTGEAIVFVPHDRGNDDKGDRSTHMNLPGPK